MALRPFARLSCSPLHGVRFCAGNGTTQRVPSFDGVPLDADVTLPATGRGPFPLLVLLHGLGGNKSEFESSANDGNLDNVTMAGQGWAVLTYTARGFGASCGTAASRKGTPGCARGWIQLADQRYEIRDTEYLAGMLVDENIAQPDFAVSGVSYGAGQSLELAMLKNRMMLQGGDLVPLTSPQRHVPMSVAAAFAQWAWDDLDSALLPNGSLSSTTNTPPASDRTPVGVLKQGWISLLYGVTAANYLAPPNVDPQSNLTVWYNRANAGEPYGPATKNSLRILQRYKSPMGIALPKGGPAPTAIGQGWTDTLFPASEALHYTNRLSADSVRIPLFLLLGDIGHGWAQNKSADTQQIVSSGINFLNAEVLHRGPVQTGVLALGTTCPSTASSPKLRGTTLSGLKSGSLSLLGAQDQVVTSNGGSAAVASALDPSYAGKPLCNPLPAAREPGTAVYSRPVGSSPVTLIGAPEITASVRVNGNYPELVGRLWDVGPNGTKRQIVAMGVQRPHVNQAKGTTTNAKADASISFQLNPNDYTFPAGDTIELELVGSNPPYFRKSNGTFSVIVEKLTATLPTR